MMIFLHRLLSLALPYHRQTEGVEIAFLDKEKSNWHPIQRALLDKFVLRIFIKIFYF